MDKLSEKEKNKLKLDTEEREILEAFESGKLIQIPVSQEEKNRIMLATRNTLKKINRINIRIPSSDLQRIKKRAEDAGMPYQTLIGAILHQYAEGKLNASI